MRLLVYLSALLLVTTAAPETTRIYIGELYEHNLGDSSTTATGKNDRPLPSWLMIRNQILQGIPTENDVGIHTIVVSHRENK